MKVGAMERISVFVYNRCVFVCICKKSVPACILHTKTLFKSCTFIYQCYHENQKANFFKYFSNNPVDFPFFLLFLKKKMTHKKDS